MFGARVASLVAELSDDKSIEKAERKCLQIMNAAKKSPEACLIKFADKINNVQAMEASPPKHWPKSRILAYFDWAEQVVAGLPHKPAACTALFEKTLGDMRRIVANRD